MTQQLNGVIKSSRNVHQNGRPSTNGHQGQNHGPAYPVMPVRFSQLRPGDPTTERILTGTENIVVVNLHGQTFGLGERNLVPHYHGRTRSAISLAYTSAVVLRPQGQVAAFVADIVAFSVAAVQALRCENEREHQQHHRRAGTECPGKECLLRGSALSRPGQQERLQALIRAEMFLNTFQGARALPELPEDESTFVAPVEAATGVPYGLIFGSADLSVPADAKISAIANWLQHGVLLKIAKEWHDKGVKAYIHALKTTQIFAIYRSNQDPTAVPWNEINLQNYGQPVLAYVVGESRLSLELGRCVASVVLVHKPAHVFSGGVSGSLFTVSNFAPQDAQLLPARDTLSDMGDGQIWHGNTIWLGSNRQSPCPLEAGSVLDVLLTCAQMPRPAYQKPKKAEKVEPKVEVPEAEVTVVAA